MATGFIVIGFTYDDFIYWLNDSKFQSKAQCFVSYAWTYKNIVYENVEAENQGFF